jgi:CSLREA domain-containing protein
VVLTNNLDSTNTLLITSPGSTIRGLVFNGVSPTSNTTNGLLIAGASATGNRVIGNYFGTNAAGTADATNAEHGVLVTNDSAGNIIGGYEPGDRNLVSGSVRGIMVLGAGAGNVVQGNYAGTNAAGTGAIPNGDGIYISAPGSIVGGSLDTLDGLTPSAGCTGACNLVSGNNWCGISTNGSDLLIQGNMSGVQADGVTALPNGHCGAYIGGGENVQLGGTGINEGNVLANSTLFHGVWMPAGAGIAIQGNSIYGNNQLGIDLADDGATANDLDDADSGPNQRQNYPTLNFARISAGGLQIEYSLDSSATNSAYPVAVDFYEADSAVSGEGRAYLGSATLYAPGIGTVNLGDAAALGVGAGDALVATATDADGNTSEFGAVVITAEGAYTVNSVADAADAVPGDGQCETATPGECTLRAAIEEANTEEGPGHVGFDIAGAGPHIITPVTSLPVVTGSLNIDGTTQPGYGGAPLITLDGSTAVGDGLHLGAGSDGSAIRGLAVNSFSGAGIVVDSDDSVIAGNYVGVGSDGVTPLGNGMAGIIIEGNGGMVGGGLTAGGVANIIANNAGAGVIVSGSGAANALRGNVVYGNSGLPIDLNGDGPTDNDLDDADSGPNNLQNSPVLMASQNTVAGMVVAAAFMGVPDAVYIIDFYQADSCGSAGQGEALTYLGALGTRTTPVTLDSPGGRGLVYANFGYDVPDGQFITATLTDATSGDTSELWPVCRWGRITAIGPGHTR